MNTRKSINLLLMLACTLCLATVAHSQTAAQTQALRDANNGNWSAVFRALDGKTINPSIVDSNQDSLMHIAIRYPKDPSILDQLAARNVPLESQNKQGQTPFMVTMTNGAYINAIWLLKKGIQVGGKIDGMDTAQSLLRQHQILAKIYYDEARKRNRPVHPSYLADTLSMALFRGDEKSVLDKLVNGAVPETEDLDMAIFSENPNVLRMLADGFFISRQNVVELASQAAYAGATGSLDFLLGANLGIEVSNGKGDELAEPAMAGARNGALGPFTKTLQILLNHGYKPDSRMAAQALEKELDDESVMFILKNCEHPAARYSDHETLYSLATRNQRSPALLSYIEEHATSNQEKALEAIRSGRIELFNTSYARLDAEGKLDIAANLFSERMDVYKDEKRRKAFEPFIDRVLASGINLNASIQSERFYNPRPLWLLLATDRPTLKRAVSAGADLCATTEESYGRGDPEQSYFFTLLENLSRTARDNSEEHLRIKMQLASIIPLLPNPAPFKTRADREIQDPVFTLLSFPDLLPLWLGRKPDLNFRAEILLGDPDAWSRDSATITPLGMAVYMDDNTVIQALLAAGAEINATFEVKGAVYTPLGFAINRQAQATMLLRSRGGVEKP